MSRYKDNERNESIIKVIVEIKEFLSFHKKRVSLLKRLLKKQVDDRLVFQISILGLESLARVMYPNDTSSKSRFVKLLSRTMERKEAIRFYDFCRCPLVHEGFLFPFSSTELWDEENIAFLTTYEKYVDVDIMGSVDYPAETAMEIYEELIYCVKDFFERKKIKSRILKDIKVYGVKEKENQNLS